MCSKWFIVLSASLTVALAASVGKSFNGVKTPSAFIEAQDCIDNPEIHMFPHYNCEQFWGCDENNEPYEDWCPEGEIFDSEFQFCGVEGQAICWTDVENVDPPIHPEDSECPLNTNEVVFLPGEYCDEYYICLNGVPNLMSCRNGQHWNDLERYCDEPHLAGCDETAVAHPPSLPDCQMGFVGTKPHPNNCNWFLYCDNGNRSIQQCQHLFHYDVPQNRCLFLNVAKCIKDL